MRSCAVIMAMLAVLLLTECTPTDASVYSVSAEATQEYLIEFSVQGNRVVRRISYGNVFYPDTLRCRNSHFTADSLKEMTRNYLKLLHSRSAGNDLFKAGSQLSDCLLKPLFSDHNTHAGTYPAPVIRISLSGAEFLNNLPFSSLPVPAPQPGYLSEYFIVHNHRVLPGLNNPASPLYNTSVTYRPEYTLYNYSRTTDFPAVKNEAAFSDSLTFNQSNDGFLSADSARPYYIHHFSGHTRRPDSPLAEQTAGADLLVLNTCNSLDHAALWQAGREQPVSILGTVSAIEDDFSSRFISEFYRNLNSILMQNNFSGQPAAAALRETRLSFMEHPYYSHPSYWGAYELIEF